MELHRSTSLQHNRVMIKRSKPEAVACAASKWRALRTNCHSKCIGKSAWRHSGMDKKASAGRGKEAHAYCHLVQEKKADKLQNREND